MRILIHGINFFPELTGIGKYSGEMAEWLAAQGHEVRVVTAPPYYPQWRIADGYANEWVKDVATGLPQPFGLRNDEVSGALRAYRCPLWVPAKPSGLKRVLHLASFALSSFPVMLWQIFWRPDVVIVVEPPLFCAPQAWLVARLSGGKAWLHIQDYEVDAAFDLGLLRGAALRGLVAAGERWLMRRFDRVSTISQRMLDRALAKGVAPERAVLFPNWVEIKGQNKAGLRSEDLGLEKTGLRTEDLGLEKTGLRTEDLGLGKAGLRAEGLGLEKTGLRTEGLGLEKTGLRTEDLGLGKAGLRTEDLGLSESGQSGYRAELGIAEDAVVALYSGNMGGKQGLEILAQVARIGSRIEGRGSSAKAVSDTGSVPCSLPLVPDVVFVFCGNGAGRDDLFAQCAELSNVRFMDLQPLERLDELLSFADIHLLPQRADAADLVMPSKLTGMLASGRPVVATAYEGTELASVVAACGLVVPPEQPQALLAAISTLAKDAALRARLGATGRAYAEANLDREAVLKKFETELKAVTREKR